MPFTPAEFLSVFEQYDRTLGPGVAVVAYVLGLGALALALRGGRRASRAVLAILALFWFACGAGYHLAFFSRINPAAYAFGIAFLLEAALLADAALRPEPPTFRLRRTIGGVSALALAAYALVAYPLLGAAAGHGWPRGPAFALAPCPTTIFTIALLLLAEAPSVVLLAIPILWSAVGVSAAAHLGILEDYGLAAAGAVALAALAAQWATRRRAVAGAPPR